MFIFRLCIKYFFLCMDLLFNTIKETVNNKWTKSYYWFSSSSVEHNLGVVLIRSKALFSTLLSSISKMSILLYTCNKNKSVSNAIITISLLAILIMEFHINKVFPFAGSIWGHSVQVNGNTVLPVWQTKN